MIGGVPVATETDFKQLFVDLGIDVKPLDDSYSPDEYGKRLMAPYYCREGVSYSSSTIIVNQRVVDSDYRNNQ